MKTLMISAAAIALCLGASAANAQEDQTTTTTTVQTPTDTTTTKTTEGTDVYGNYRKTVTSTKRFNAAAFVAPSGFTYHRFSVGQHVPDALMSDSVVLNNYREYALVEPPSGLTWVRDGQDALLIDTRTGEVIQADYDLFD